MKDSLSSREFVPHVARGSCAPTDDPATFRCATRAILALGGRWASFRTRLPGRLER